MQPLSPAGFLLAHGLGQDAFESDLRRAAIVVGNPAGQFQDLGGHEGLCSDDSKNGLELCMCRLLGQTSYTAHYLSPTKGHLNAAANADLRDEIGRDGIIKFLSQGDLE